LFIAIMFDGGYKLWEANHYAVVCELPLLPPSCSDILLSTRFSNICNPLSSVRVRESKLL
jgi:hypothetical protein